VEFTQTIFIKFRYKSTANKKIYFIPKKIFIFKNLFYFVKS